MPMFHAVVSIDHHRAKVLQFDSEEVEVHNVKAHDRETRQHGSAVRTEHEFFAEVCAELTHIPQIVLTGSHTALADFRHYVEKHRPLLAGQIVGWETADHPTERQLVAYARQYFVRHETMAPLPLK